MIVLVQNVLPTVSDFGVNSLNTLPVFSSLGYSQYGFQATILSAFDAIAVKVSCSLLATQSNTNKSCDF
jgi:hypothetical protein